MKQESLKENETTENEEDLRLAKQIESEEREKLLKTQQSKHVSLELCSDVTDVTALVTSLIHMFVAERSRCNGRHM